MHTNSSLSGDLQPAEGEGATNPALREEPSREVDYLGSMALSLGDHHRGLLIEGYPSSGPVAANPVDSAENGPPQNSAFHKLNW